MAASEPDRMTAEVLKASIHELKGPANRLRLLSQMLSRSAAGLDDHARKLLGYVDESAAAVANVAEAMRTFSEITARPMHRQPLDLKLPLEAAMANMAGELAGARVTHGELPVVSADGFLISRLFQELLTNAVRARGERELHIHVSNVAEGSEQPCISVADNGPGIDSGMTERIFRPFEKLAPGPGAGLGLTICRKLIEMHGGRMWAEERAGGAEFRFVVDEAE